jgi:mono/diheme cytochrome c family protein
VRLLRTMSAALAVTGLAALAAGCGQEREPDLVNGKALFVQKCGSCHTLGRANTSGVQGPNLDRAFRAALESGMTRRTVRGVVRTQIKDVRRTSIMPRNLVRGSDAQDVATYVSLVVDKAGQDTGALAQAGKPKVSSKPVKEKGGQLKIDADPSGALAFTASKALAKAGMLTLLMANKASIQHDISVKGAGLNKKGPTVAKGGTSKVSVKLKPGKYEFYCSVPGHEAGGMKGTLTVK